MTTEKFLRDCCTEMGRSPTLSIQLVINVKVTLKVLFGSVHIRDCFFMQLKGFSPIFLLMDVSFSPIQVTVCPVFSRQTRR